MGSSALVRLVCGSKHGIETSTTTRAAADMASGMNALGRLSMVGNFIAPSPEGSEFEPACEREKRTPELWLASVRGIEKRGRIGLLVSSTWLRRHAKHALA